MLIDFHVHVFPDQIAAASIDVLQKRSGLTALTDGTLRDTAEKMDQWGVDRAVLLNVATRPGQYQTINRAAAEVQNERFVSFGSIHYLDPSPAEIVQGLADAGIKGVKLHPDYQDIFIDDPRWFELYDALCQFGLMAVFHTGFDYQSPEKIHGSPDRCLRVSELFPRLKCVFAHMGGFMMWDDAEALLCERDVYFDTAMCAGRLESAQAARMIQKHGAQRVLFGSDCPWQSPKEMFDWVDSLPISTEEKELIFFKNAQRLLTR